jgi:hypothetical protein
VLTRRLAPNVDRLTPVERLDPPPSPLPVVALCPHCIEPVPDDAHFCPRCVTPLTSIATTIYPWAAWAMGSAIGRLIHQRPPTRFAFVGTWVCAPWYALTYLAAAFSSSTRELIDSRRRTSFGDAVLDTVAVTFARVYALAAAGIVISVLIRVMRNRLVVAPPVDPGLPSEPPIETPDD